MNVLLVILIIIAIILAIVLILALLTKKSYNVEKEVIINKPKNDVFNYIRLLKNQNNYSKWAKLDAHMKQDFKGTDGTVGFVSAWDSDMKNVGKGEQTIKDIKEGKSIDYELHFLKPFDAKAAAYLTTHTVSDRQTKVIWGFIGKMNYPMNIMLVFMNMEKMIGDDLTTGLTNLKTVLEK